ncbi:uncharacterized protein METZ01_LOCUS347142, partial [marine metagenome]
VNKLFNQLQNPLGFSTMTSCTGSNRS